MGVHVVSTILRVIFNHENQCVSGVFAVRYFFHQQPNSVIVVRNLRFHGIHAIHRFVKETEMIVRQPHQFQIRQVIMGNIFIELSLPFFKTPVIREALIKAAEIWICYLLQVRLGRGGNAYAGGSGITQQRNWRIIAGDVIVMAQVDKKSVIANTQS